MKLKTIIAVLFISLFTAAFVYEFIYVINPVINSFQTLKFINLSYQERLQLSNLLIDPVVIKLDDKLYKEYSKTKGTCFVELPYDELVKEGLDSEHPLGGQWTYRIEKTDYNLYPLPVDWGYGRNDKLYRILSGYEITAKSEQANPDNYPCIIRITSYNDIITIKGITNVP
jgi:hypothetical protein